jgi:hypothetical protein
MTGVGDRVRHLCAFPPKSILYLAHRRVDKTGKYGTIILDVVGIAVRGTRDSDSVLGYMTRRQWHLCLSLLLAVLLLVSCADDETDEPPGTATSPAVHTVQPTATMVPSPTASPTAPPTVTPTPTPPAPLAAMVNGRYIFLAEYERQVAQYEQMLLASGIDPESEEGQNQVEQAPRDVLERLIDETLVEEGAIDLGIRVSEGSVDAQLEADIAAGGGQAAFDEWLEGTGQTAEDYRAALRRSMIVRRVREVVSAEATETTGEDPFERWLAELRAAAVIERFVSD